MWPPGRGQFWPQGHNLNNFGSRPLDDAIYQTWKLWALLFPTRRFLKIAYFLTPWPTYAINQNHLNNFGRGLPRNHSSEVWSKSNERFQRRRCLSKKIDGWQTHTTKDDGQRLTLSTLCNVTYYTPAATMAQNSRAQNSVIHGSQLDNYG